MRYGSSNADHPMPSARHYEPTYAHAVTTAAAELVTDSPFGISSDGDSSTSRFIAEPNCWRLEDRSHYGPNALSRATRSECRSVCSDCGNASKYLGLGVE